jgi:hypothetical protein
MSPTSIGDDAKDGACTFDVIAVSKSQPGFIFDSKARIGAWTSRASFSLERMPIKKPLHAPPFLSLHALAAPRGEGLRPEFVTLFSRLAQGADPNLSEAAPAPEGCSPDVESDHQSIMQDQAAPKKTANRKD